MQFGGKAIPSRFTANVSMWQKWGEYDDSGILLVTAPTLDRCVERCERYIRGYRRLFVSKTYVATCQLLMGAKMETVEQRASRKLYALLNRLGASDVLFGILTPMAPAEVEKRLDALAYEYGIDFGGR